MTSKRKRTSLADKISSLVTAAPTNFGSDDEVEDTKAKVVEQFEDSDNSDGDFRDSSIRKRNVDLLDQIDERYKGKKISRKDIYEDEMEGNSSDELEENLSENNFSDADGMQDSNEDERNSNVEDDSGDDGAESERAEEDSDNEQESDGDSNELNSDNIYEDAAEGDSSDQLEEDLSENNFSDADDMQDSNADERNSNVEDDSGDDGAESQRAEEYSDNDQESDGDSNELNSDNEVDSEIDEDNPLRRKTKSDLNFQHMSTTNVRSEVEKGNSVRNQLKVWESLLEMRIKLQKCLITSNKMPQYDVYKEFKKDNTFTITTNDAKHKLTRLLDNMLKLQSTLLKNYSETSSLNKIGQKRKADSNEIEKEEDGYDDPMDEEIPSDTDDENEDNGDASNSIMEDKEENTVETPKKLLKLVDYEKILTENHKSYTAYRNSVIQKWNDKTRIATGNLTKGTNQPVVKQIDYILNDKTKLLKRTQLKRSEYEIMGKTIEEDQDGRRVHEHDTEIYDDDDFYHQLLRELIEYKSSDVTDPIQLSKQWIQLQNMRSKMKRKVDTRATKGRRIRYNVHTKLVNFMAPITFNDTWTELAKNELYSSLFGKIKPAPNEMEN